MKSKKRQKKNYAILIVIYIAVIAIVLYLASWYSTYKNYQKEIPVLQNVVSEINSDELEHYLTENPTQISYLCVASNSECREFEESIKSALEKNDYQDLTYVNLENENDMNTYIKTLLDKYGPDFNIERVPCLIKFTEGKITAVEDGLNGALLTRDEALSFLDINDKTGQ